MIDSHFLPVEIQIHRLITPIEKAECRITARKGFNPYLQITIVDESESLETQRILIHSNNFLVGKEVPDVLIHRPQVISGHPGCGKHAPQAEEGAVFRDGLTAIAYFKHIRI